MKIARNEYGWRRVCGVVVGVLGTLVAASTGRAQHVTSTAGAWSMLDRVPAGEDVTPAWVRPTRGQVASLDSKALELVLKQAPIEDTPQAGAPLIVSLPDPEGNWQRFKLVEYSVMEAPLAAAHPELKTYRGEGIDDPYATIRCSLTPIGFQAQVRTPGETGPASGMWHIDPYTRGNTSLHMSYRHADAGGAERTFDCQTVDAGANVSFRARSTTGPTRRQYRLALAVTGETTVWAGGAAGGLTLATNVTNQLNGIYETELAVRFVLVANETAIVYPDPTTDPFTTPNSASATNSNLQSALDSTIGASNYDVGHVIHYTTTGNNGLAGGIGTVCITGSKGAGYSAYSNPNDAYFVIDYVSHELGHQFGGHHTQSNCGGMAGDSAVYLVESGSGTTIMSYAGICGTAYNVQPHNDPYFNGLNINQINTYLAGTSCAATASTGNAAPTVTTPTAYSIPIGTPFTLTAAASDPDGDPLTYCWEEQDGYALGPVNGMDNGANPLVRSRTATTSPSRTIPRLSTILANTTDVWEALPQLPRTMNWRITVRDNRSGGGGVNQATVALNVANTGPFQVTSPNGGETISGMTTVTWTVAGTNVAPISVANVRISLSTDGGNTFPTILASSVPNNGSAMVALPNTPSPTSRIKVEAIGNIFFDVSDGNFRIPAPVEFASGGAPTITDTTGNDNANGRIDPGENRIAVTIPVSNLGYSTATSVVGTLTSSTPTVSVLNATAAYLDLAPGVTGSSGTPFILDISSAHACGDPITLSLAMTSAQGPGSAAPLAISLPTGITYVSPSTFTYSGAAAAIPDNSAAGVNITLPVSGVGAIANLTFRFNGTTCSTSGTSTTVGLNHSNVGDLIVKLTSPFGTTVTLINRPGGNGAGTDTGNNFCNTVLDDGATASIQNATSSAAPLTGTYQPASPLSTFDGQNGNGNWVLNVADVVAGSTGSVRSFSLVVSSEPGCTPPLTVIGACCDVAGACTSVVESACTGSSAYQGDSTSCTPNPCMPITVQVQVARIGSGSGTVTSTPAAISCGQTCQASFTLGSGVVLAAAPAINSVFVGWSGGLCTGNGDCSFNASGPVAINAEFRCKSDFDGSGAVGVQDIFDYLNAWFNGDPATEMDGIPGLSVQDIFAFLEIWFAGC